MPVKNHTSNSANTFNAIQKCLAEHKAQQIMFEYNDNGRIVGVNFSLKLNHMMINEQVDAQPRVLGFKLPARVENVEVLFREQKQAKARYKYVKAELTDAEKEQAYRTAWANIRDWVTAQMAMIDIGMVKMEEVFLPYAVNKQGKTYFETMEETKFALPSGAEEGTVVV